MHFHGINLVFLPHKTRQWHIHFDRLKASGNLFGQPTTLFPQTFPPQNPSIISWICSLTPPGLDSMSDTLWAILPAMFLLVSKGIKVLIDPKAIMYLLGTEMDYKKEKFSSQFIFKNPNETERCGCGESFKI